MSPIWIILAIVVVIVLFLIAIYNGLTKKRILVREGWSGIGTFLQQRNDMIPNLVETVKGYAVNQRRRYYNGAVRDYNQAVAVFPNNVVAGMFEFIAEPFFQEEAGAGSVPKVSFS